MNRKVHSLHSKAIHFKGKFSPLDFEIDNPSRALTPREIAYNSVSAHVYEVFAFKEEDVNINKLQEAVNLLPIKYPFLNSSIRFDEHDQWYYYNPRPDYTTIIDLQGNMESVSSVNDLLQRTCSISLESIDLNHQFHAQLFECSFPEPLLQHFTHALLLVIPHSAVDGTSMLNAFRQVLEWVEAPSLPSKGSITPQHSPLWAIQGCPDKEMPAPIDPCGGLSPPHYAVPSKPGWRDSPSVPKSWVRYIPEGEQGLYRDRKYPMSLTMVAVSMAVAAGFMLASGTHDVPLRCNSIDPYRVSHLFKRGRLAGRDLGSLLGSVSLSCDVQVEWQRETSLGEALDLMVQFRKQFHLRLETDEIWGLLLRKQPPVLPPPSHMSFPLKSTTLVSNMGRVQPIGPLHMLLGGSVNALSPPKPMLANHFVLYTPGVGTFVQGNGNERFYSAHELKAIDDAWFSVHELLHVKGLSVQLHEVEEIVRTLLARRD
eukprot:gnl/Dysnectes_brevis/3717_a4762_1060.p1 GENE.gnl/Dysnectes_brevis/3717_a4762_1060~~gnl/Dysnectes_brevis/3717_a4762_1060.p1  ORF type:complete len:484 (+),score=87.18 gnl/Dysnectes_brevis/3717_a4762_1060:242-1693(+)